LIYRTAYGLLPLLTAHENLDTGKTGSMNSRVKDNLSGKRKEERFRGQDSGFRGQGKAEERRKR